MISSYEKIRLDNIRRNELELERLGFNSNPEPVQKKKPTKKPVQTKKEDFDSDLYQTRRTSSRSSAKRPSGYFNEQSQFQLKRERDDDADEEYEPSDDRDNTKSSKRIKQDRSIVLDKSNKELLLLSEETGPEPILKFEAALTGRSSCRKCRTTIEQGDFRVGMKSWIMGRSSWYIFLILILILILSVKVIM